MTPVRIFDRLHIKGLHAVGDVEIVVGNDIIEKLDGLVLTHVLDAQQTFALGNMPFVIGGGLLVRGVELPYRPVVLSALLNDEHARRGMADRTSSAASAMPAGPAPMITRSYIAPEV